MISWNAHIAGAIRERRAERAILPGRNRGRRGQVSIGSIEHALDRVGRCRHRGSVRRRWLRHRGRCRRWGRCGAWLTTITARLHQNRQGHSKQQPGRLHKRLTHVIVCDHAGEFKRKGLPSPLASVDKRLAASPVRPDAKTAGSTSRRSGRARSEPASHCRADPSRSSSQRARQPSIATALRRASRLLIRSPWST